jgi:ATP phosphoribosyltransferase regulatory subunit
LCYFGRVFRLRQHSEFQRRELIQAGVELIGPSTAEGDVEIVALCAKALEATTSRPHRLSLGHAGVLATILRALDLDHSNVLRLRSVLHKKSPEQLNALQTELEIPAQIAGVLSELPHLYGDPDEVLVRAQTLESRLPSLSSPLDRLRAVVRGLTAAGLRERCLLDLGEVSGFGYYSGLVFRAYLPGIGQAVASGGRYDHLLARYGPDRPAAGFAIDEEGLTESEGPR